MWKMDPRLVSRRYFLVHFDSVENSGAEMVCLWKRSIVGSGTLASTPIALSPRHPCALPGVGVYSPLVDPLARRRAGYIYPVEKPGAECSGN
mmetsp:Transcript_26980/g.50386  ORF Transcript_26980/g.50386 Transcript_26980/m.50386 type:complete len:92 (-) Transcript_26980:58-333(-)